VVETKWVFLALYNIVLNLVTVGPFLFYTNFDDDYLAFCIVVSIDFSGGGIVLAVLAPRLYQKYRKGGIQLPWTKKKIAPFTPTQPSTSRGSRTRDDSRARDNSEGKARSPHPVKPQHFFVEQETANLNTLSDDISSSHQGKQDQSRRQGRGSLEGLRGDDQKSPSQENIGQHDGNLISPVVDSNS